MSKIICLLLCVVAASLTKVSAITEEEKAAFNEAMAPIIAQCATEHEMSDGDVEAAKDAKDADDIKPCFLACVLKKNGLIDSKGLYDAEKGLEELKKFVKSDEDYAKFEAVGKECSKVNEESVSDGEAGCERAKLIIACAIEHKAEMPF